MSSKRTSFFCASHSLCEPSGRSAPCSSAASSSGVTSSPPSTTMRPCRDTAKPGVDSARPVVSGVTLPDATSMRDRWVTRLCSISASTLLPSGVQRGCENQRSIGAGTRHRAGRDVDDRELHRRVVDPLRPRRPAGTRCGVRPATTADAVRRVEIAVGAVELRERLLGRAGTRLDQVQRRPSSGDPGPRRDG